jgi:hypothetical protein
VYKAKERMNKNGARKICRGRGDENIDGKIPHMVNYGKSS